MPAIKTSMPMPKMEEDVPTPTVADSQSKSDSVGQNSTGWEEPQPERGSESVSTQREELQISSKPLTNSLLGSSAPAFSSNSGSSNGPPAAQTQVKETQGEGPVPIAHQQPVTHQTHAYSAPPTAYPMNPYYGPAPSQPWGYPIPPPHPHPQPHDHVPPNTPSSLPSSAGYPDPYAAFSQAAAASLYNPALVSTARPPSRHPPAG